MLSGKESRPVINEKLLARGLKSARHMFRRMPEYVLEYLVRELLERGCLDSKLVGLSRWPTDTLWDNFCAPYSTLEVAWMTWANGPIDISEGVLDDETLENMDYCVKETFKGRAPINLYCMSQFWSYVDYVKSNRTIPGTPLIAYKVGDKYRLLNGHLRVAAAFYAKQLIFTVTAYVGNVPSIDEQRKELLGAVAHAQQDVGVIEDGLKCMFPGCEEKAIGSHSQQEHGQLDNVAEDGYVYALDRNHINQLAPYFFKGSDGFPRLIKQRISRATVFPGFCNAHDTSVFDCIERSALVKDTPEQVLAFHIRGLSYIWARQRHEWMYAMKVWNHMDEVVGCLCPNPQVVNWSIYVPADYELLIKPCFRDNAVCNLRWVWRIVDRNIGVSCASAITPMDDRLADKLIGEATDYKERKLKRPRHFASLNVVPQRDCTHVVVAWHKDIDTLAKGFTDRLASNDLKVFQCALNEAIFDKSEDYAVTPSLWESLNDEERKEFECAIIPEHVRGRMRKVPSLINLSGCNVI